MRAIKKLLLRFQFVRDLDLKIRGPRWTPPGVAETLAIDAIKLPPNAGFHELEKRADQIEGMMSPFSMAVMDMMFGFQASLEAKGDILEIGAFKGKSAVILGNHLRDSERLVLVDIKNYLDPAAIQPFAARVDYIVSPSENLRTTLPNYRSRRSGFRFVHIDASHGYQETFSELQMADELLAPLGVVALDDFTNLNYSQNMAAIFKYLFTAKTKLVPLLITDIKAYLCSQRDFNYYAALILNQAIPEMRSRGMDVLLARTCYLPEYRAFYLRTREGGESGIFYADDLYLNQVRGI